MNQEILTQSYFIKFAAIRELNIGKKNAVNNILHTQKYIANTLYHDLYTGIASWKDMSKEDNTFIRKHYESFFHSTKLKAVYTQNMVQESISGYYDTLKGLKKLNIKTGRKDNLKKPYQKGLKQYNLDERHFKDKIKTEDGYIKQNPLQKDLNTGIYYFGIKSPINNKENYGKLIWLPLTGYKNIQETLDKIVSGDFKEKYSFSLTENGINLIIQRTFIKDIISNENKKSIKDLKNITKNIDNLSLFNDTKINKNNSNDNVLGLDFGKNIALSNGKLFNLQKFYNKVKKLQGQLQILQQQKDTLKNKRLFGPDYDILIEEIKKLNNRIFNIRKSTYFHTANKILKELQENNTNSLVSDQLNELNDSIDILAIEDLSFLAIEKNSKKYKGKNYNKMINIMSRGQWDKILINVFNRTLGCSQLQKIQPAYTSQTCSACHHTDKNNRKGIKFHCLQCGYDSHSDINASLCIKQVAVA